MIKLGSLFDGSGGFPLAGVMHGVTPVWASEIEPYPMRVTTARFPAMKHLGDVTKIDGAAIEPVDIITFGSPCQDLSVAGKQAGLHKGERSNLFFEAIRIIKEMREATDGTYPRIAVWENVPGAYSSNKGEDFRAVLQAFASIGDQAADVPMPQRGKWLPAGCVVGTGFSVAWRTLDAQYNGVPQRRRRIYLVADFGSERAGEILFEQEGVRGDSAESGTEGQGAADNAEGSPGGGANPLIFKERAGKSSHAVCSFMGGQGSRARSIAWTEEATPPLKAVPSGGNTVPDVCYAVDRYNQTIADTMQTVRPAVGGDNVGAVCYPIDSHQPSKLPRKYIIRRLTPLECLRLQGLPDGWLDGVDGSDSAKYKMLGNGIAMPNAAHVVGCAVKLIKETQT